MKKSRFSEEQMVAVLREADRTSVVGADRKLTHWGSADPKLTQVFYWLYLNFRQEQKGDHHGNVGQDSTAAFTRQEVAARDSKTQGFVAQHRAQMAENA